MDASRGGPGWAWFDGRTVPFGEAQIPLEDRGLQFGESLYEVVAVVGGSPFRLEAHVDRMQAGARELGLEAGVPDLATWRRLIRDLHRKDPQRTAILYAQLTGGDSVRRHVPARRPEPRFFAYLQEIEFPSPGDVSRGIAAVTVPDFRWERRHLKTTMLLAAVLAKQEAATRGADEALFVGQDGFVNEGAASTVFVVHQRSVVTPPASNRLLAGVSAQSVRAICLRLGVGYREAPVTLTSLVQADEVFVASTTLLLMPVVRIDGRSVGSGTAGPTALQLAYHFQRDFWGPQAS